MSEAEFLDMRDKDEFAEWAEVHGHRYGTPVKALEGARSVAGSTCCSISTPTAPGSCSSTRRPCRSSSWAPSMKELEARLRERNSDAPVEIARRLARAREEISAWRQYDYLIINRDVKEAVDQLATVIQAERWRTSRLTLKFPDVEVPE